MASRARSDDDEMISGINVTPLVDVTLVLLIIMMVTAKIILSQGLTMELPKGSSTPTARVDQMLSVKVTADAKIYLNGDMLPNVEALARRTREAKKLDPDVKAVISGEGKAKHGAVIRVLDTLKRNGVEKIAFTKPKEEMLSVPPAAPVAPTK